MHKDAVQIDIDLLQDMDCHGNIRPFRVLLIAATRTVEAKIRLDCLFVACKSTRPPVIRQHRGHKQTSHWLFDSKAQCASMDRQGQDTRGLALAAFGTF